MVYQLDDDIWFPDPHLADDDGMLAVGGDLSTERLKLAYYHGIFPWFSFRDSEPVWYCPKERFVIFPHEIHISHSMRTLMNKNLYTVTFNKSFRKVIRNCSKLRYDMEGAWLGEDMIKAFTRLYEMKRAVSVEVWEKGAGDTPGRLVGGLYGVVVNNCFCGESMFSLVPSASKLALIYLAQAMQAKRFSLIDCQFRTPHLESMGGRYIPYDEYIKYLHFHDSKSMSLR